MEQGLSLDLDFAKISLEGKRYSEAERKYEAILRTDPTNTVAWCGLGISKYGLFQESESNTIEEVFYCFKKIKTLHPDEIEVAEILVINQSFEVIKNLYLEYAAVLNVNEEAKKQMLRSIITGAASAVIAGISSGSGNRRPSLFGGLAAVGGTAASVSNYTNAKRTQLTAEETIRLLRLKIQSIIDHVHSFVSNNQEVDAFDKRVDEIKMIVEPPAPIQPVSTQQLDAGYSYPFDDEDDKWYNKQWGVTLWILGFWPVGLYALSKSKYKSGIMLKVLLIVAGAALFVFLTSRSDPN